MDLLSLLRDKPVIAAFRDIDRIKFLALKDTNVLFILGGTIFDLPYIVEQARKYQKQVFVDIDLIKGIGKDAPGIRFLAQESQVNGIITTRSNLIKSGQKEDLISIQRVFVLDSESLNGGLGVIEKSSPDAVEILPGLILPKVMKKIRTITSIPIIAGGLITQKEEIDEILASGAIGISTSSSHLFGFKRKGKDS
ncbi:MAG: glycerol-3-phosphate responsive antiterminator [Thermodesulfobacteriota bacterium]